MVRSRHLWVQSKHSLTQDTEQCSCVGNIHYCALVLNILYDIKAFNLKCNTQALWLQLEKILNKYIPLSRRTPGGSICTQSNSLKTTFYVCQRHWQAFITSWVSCIWVCKCTNKCIKTSLFVWICFEMTRSLSAEFTGTPQMDTKPVNLMSHDWDVVQ